MKTPGPWAGGGRPARLPARSLHPCSLVPAFTPLAHLPSAPGVGLGVQVGNGFMITRLSTGKWSAPCYVKVAAGQAGFIVGVEKVRAGAGSRLPLALRFLDMPTWRDSPWLWRRSAQCLARCHPLGGTPFIFELFSRSLVSRSFRLSAG